MLRERFARLQADLKRANDLRLVAPLDPRRSYRIDFSQDPVKIFAALSFGEHFQPIPPVSGPFRSIEQPFCQGTQVQTRTTNQNRHFAAVANIAEYSPRFTLVVACSENCCWLADINHVVRYAAPFFRSRFCRSYVEVPKN